MSIVNGIQQSKKAHITIKQHTCFQQTPQSNRSPRVSFLSHISPSARIRSRSIGCCASRNGSINSPNSVARSHTAPETASHASPRALVVTRLNPCCHSHRSVSPRSTVRPVTATASSIASSLPSKPPNSPTASPAAPEIPPIPDDPSPRPHRRATAGMETKSRPRPPTAAVAEISRNFLPLQTSEPSLRRRIFEKETHLRLQVTQRGVSRDGGGVETAVRIDGYEGAENRRVFGLGHGRGGFMGEEKRDGVGAEEGKRGVVGRGEMEGTGVALDGEEGAGEGGGEDLRGGAMCCLTGDEWVKEGRGGVGGYGRNCLRRRMCGGSGESGVCLRSASAARERRDCGCRSPRVTRFEKRGSDRRRRELCRNWTEEPDAGRSPSPSACGSRNNRGLAGGNCSR